MKTRSRGQLIFWEGCEKRASFAHGAAILALAVSPTSSDFFSADDRGRIRIWDGAALERGSTASLVSGCAVLSLAVVEDTLLLAGDASGCIRVWDLQRSLWERPGRLLRRGAAQGSGGSCRIGSAQGVAQTCAMLVLVRIDAPMSIMPTGVLYRSIVVARSVCTSACRVAS